MLWHPLAPSSEPLSRPTFSPEGRRAVRRSASAIMAADRFPNAFNIPAVSGTVLPDSVPAAPILSGWQRPGRGRCIHFRRFRRFRR